MRKSVATAEVVMAAVLVVLLVLGVVLGSGGGSSSGGGVAGTLTRVHPIATRVEAIRGLRFRRLPQPVVVTPEETRRAQLADLDRNGGGAQLASSGEVLELLGLVKPGTDLRAVVGDVSGQEVVGYYDTERKRLAIVDGALASDPVTGEITLAHELDHALDDQRFGLRDLSGSTADDAASAYEALVEGTATVVMQRYAARYITTGGALESALAGLGSPSASTDAIPPYVQRSLLFSYLAGAKFVSALYAVAHDWRLVNIALAHDPPRSTEQIMHPRKYMAGEQPLRVSLPPVGPLLGGVWRRRTGGTLGEFDTGELLRLGVPKPRADAAAAGWGGARYELWTRPAPAHCAAPCRAANVLVLAWRWDTARDAVEFDAAARAYVAKALRGAATAFVTAPQASVLALAPSRALARRIAARALGSAPGQG